MNIEEKLNQLAKLSDEDLQEQLKLLSKELSKIETKGKAAKTEKTKVKWRTAWKAKALLYNIALVAKFRHNCTRCGGSGYVEHARDAYRCYWCNNPDFDRNKIFWHKSCR